MQLREWSAGLRRGEGGKKCVILMAAKQPEDLLFCLATPKAGPPLATLASG
jgi:hypothetical protein